MSSLLRSLGRKPNLVRMSAQKLKYHTDPVKPPKRADPYVIDDMEMLSFGRCVVAFGGLACLAYLLIRGAPPYPSLLMPAGDESLGNDKNPYYIKKARGTGCRIRFENHNYDVYHKPDYVLEDPRDYMYARRAMKDIHKQKIYTTD